VKKGETKRSNLRELLRYFGYPLFAVAVVVVAFLATQKQVFVEIQKGTYQILQDATLYQRITIEKYIHILSMRTELIAQRDSSSGPAALVDLLKIELLNDAQDAKAGFADTQGNLLYGNFETGNIGSQSWFLRSLGGETVVSLTAQDEIGNPGDLIISAHARTNNGAGGVLFTTLGGMNIARLLETHAYNDMAYSFVCDSAGNILFAENKLNLLVPSGSIYDLINDQTLAKGFTVKSLSESLGNSNLIQFQFQKDGEWYYAASGAVNVCDWYVFSVVSSDAADTIQRQVNLYLMGMLFIMLLVGISMAAQSYLHEQTTVAKLEKDKDLLRQSTQRYQLITQLSNEVFFEIDLSTGEISFNESFEAMFGHAPPLCTVDHLDDCMYLFFEPDRPTFQGMINHLRAGGAAAKEDLRMVNARGIIRWKRFEIFSVVDQNGNATQLVGKIADIHRQKQSMQRLLRQADSEPLTGLLNRGAFERNVKGFLAGEGLGGRHALLIMDFDNFKLVNDTLGHSKGDNLLVSFAAGMKRLFRSGDYLSRIGGDEYMVFLKNISEDGDALEKAEALRHEMLGLSRKINIPVSISVGIAIYDRDGDTFEKLYIAADGALYQVKRSGKNNISFFSVSIEQEQLGETGRLDSEETDDLGNPE
jgi:diguanylate cyclase (GGDEF)-like protein/PAS domain S-box-containing protein